MFLFLSSLERSLCNSSFSVHVRMVAVSRFDFSPSEMGHVPCFRYHLPMLHRSLCRGFVFTFFLSYAITWPSNKALCLSVCFSVCFCVRARVHAVITAVSSLVCNQ